MHRFSSRVSLCALILPACGSHEPPAPREAPRPVEVFELRAIDPAGPAQLTGSVTSWKEQDVAFEVGGRVAFVQEPGTSLRGRWESSGEVRIEGQVLAELDNRPYEIAVAAAEADAGAAQEKISVIDAQLETLLPSSLRVAVAEQERAEAEYQRYLTASETDAVAAVDVQRAKTDRDVSAARVDQAKGAFTGKEAEKRSQEANLTMSEQRVEDARWQLDRCRLFAPFDGEVSQVFVEAGGFVGPGQAVAHLVMMDPIQIDIAVSEETSRALRRYAAVQLTIPGVEEPVPARIYDLATVADPRTRTYRVSVIVRNRRRLGSLDPGDPELDLPRVQRLLLPVRGRLEHEGPLFVESRRSLHQDGEGWFVWASSAPLHPADLDPDRPVMTVRKVRVTPGERLMNYQGIYVLQELADAGELTPDSLLPLDIPADFSEGGKVLLTDSGWMLQPGQIVSVLLSEDAPQPGLFVPMNAVLPVSDGVGQVFVVENGSVRSVRLDTRDRAGALVRVQALDPADAGLVGPGAQVVCQAHFLHEGETVRVVRKREVRP